MAVQWTIRVLNANLTEDIVRPKQVVFTETDTVSGNVYRYFIIVEDIDTKQTVLAKLKALVVSSRASRASLSTITENFDSNALEAYINA